jgi:hypothetical protein
VRTPLPDFVDDFDGDRLSPGWISMRRLPDAVARVEDDDLVLNGNGRTMDDRDPAFVGRQQHP